MRTLRAYLARAAGSGRLPSCRPSCSARRDRFFALWVLEATTGMRRCELAGSLRDLLDLEAGRLDIGPTRVVVDGKVIESDGKTENAQHVLALDPFTVAVLTVHADMLDREREEFGPDYHHLGLLFCWETACRPTLTRSPAGSRRSPGTRASQTLTCMPSAAAT